MEKRKRTRNHPRKGVPVVETGYREKMCGRKGTLGKGSRYRVQTDYKTQGQRVVTDILKNTGGLTGTET